LAKLLRSKREVWS